MRTHFDNRTGFSVGELPDEENVLFPCCPRVQRLLYEVICYVGKQIAGGLVVASAYPPMMLPCLTFISVVVLTHLATNMFGCYNSSLLTHSREAILKLNTQYPNLPTIGFLFALALSLVSPKLALVMAGVAGIHNGITVGIEATTPASSIE